jgi:hypothetical protein
MLEDLHLKNLSISDIPGENVEKAVSQIRGAIGRLTQINKVPDDLMRKLLRIFQATSVDDFNASFHLVLEKQRMLDRFSSASRSNSQRNTLFGDATEEEHPKKLCVLAEALYQEKCEADEWSGASAKGKESVFAAAADAGAAGPTCWNCGAQGHTLSSHYFLWRKMTNCQTSKPEVNGTSDTCHPRENTRKKHKSKKKISLVRLRPT